MASVRYTFTIRVSQFIGLKDVMVENNAYFVGNPIRVGPEVTIKLGFDSLKDYSNFIVDWNRYLYPVVEKDSHKWYTLVVNRIKLFFRKNNND